MHMLNTGFHSVQGFGVRMWDLRCTVSEFGFKVSSLPVTATA